jgi:hypothetical protein
MSEQDLLAAYNKRLEFYQKKFNRAKVYPFTEIKTEEGGKKKISAKEFFKFYEYDRIIIKEKYIEFSDEIIDFGASISFLPIEFRSDYLFKLIFLLQFQNSGIKIIKSLWIKIEKNVSEIMNKIVFTNIKLRFYLKNISMNQLLFKFIAGTNPIYIEDEFFAIFLNWLGIEYSEKINIGTFKDFISKYSNLHSFDSFLNITSGIREKYSLSTLPIMRNYSRLGLERLIICVKIGNNKISQDILKDFFFKIPFFSLFSFLNNICQFECFVPVIFNPSIIKYLKKLRNLKIIDNYLINFNYETTLKIEFDKSLRRDQNIHKIMPFTSRKFRNMKHNTRKFPEFTSIKYSQIFSKPIGKIDHNFSILDFFIFFNVDKLLTDDATIHKLLDNDSVVSSLRILNSDQIKKSYGLLIKNKLFTTSSKIPIYRIIPKIREEYPKNKSINKLIRLLKILKIPDTSYLTKNFLDNCMLNIGNESNNYFFNRSDHSMNVLKYRFDFLLDKGYLKKYINFSLLTHLNPLSINLFILTKSIPEFTDCLFQIGIWTCKKSSIVELTLTPDTYFLFSKYFLQENLILIGIQYLFNSPGIDFRIVSFFNFYKRDWNKNKFDEYLKSIAPKKPDIIHEPFKKVNFSSWQDKLPVFQFGDFFKDLAYFTKLNKIGKNSAINREKIISFFKNYIQTQQFDFNKVTDKFDFETEPTIFPISEKKKRIFIMISQPETNINPFILKKTRVFKILFSEHLRNGWYYGGTFTNILILEYLISIEDLNDDQSKWNIEIDTIMEKFPNLNLKIFELKKDLRFFGERSLYSHSWYYDDYNYLRQPININLNGLEVKNEISFVFNSEIKYDHYHPNFLPWEFWHMIEYPVSISIIAEAHKKDLNLIEKLIKRLPAGQIFIFKNDDKNKKNTLLAIVQLKSQIDRFFENIVPILNDINCKYSISLIIPLTVYGDEFIKKKSRKANL